MSQRRKVALAYAFGVPVVLLIVLFLHTSLLRVSGSAGEITEAARVIQKVGSANFLLNAAEANVQNFVASGGGQTYNTDYQKAVAALRDNLDKLGEQTKDEQSVQAKLQTLGPLISKQLGLFDQAMAAVRKNPAGRTKLASGPDTQTLRRDIDRTMDEIDAVQQIRLQEQVRTTSRGVGMAKMLTTYGGGLLVWLVGVASFLLFYDEKARRWKGVERRVHTKVLQVLPFGVLVTTETGVVLYANPAEEALLGYKSGELLGNNATLLHDLEGPPGARIVDEILDRLGAGKTWEGELLVRKRDGTILKSLSWVMNLDVPEKVYRVFVHRGATCHAS